MGQRDSCNDRVTFVCRTLIKQKKSELFLCLVVVTVKEERMKLDTFRIKLPYENPSHPT
jgi:hypothetical protein